MLIIIICIIVIIIIILGCSKFLLCVWNLQVKHTSGPAILSFIERLSLQYRTVIILGPRKGFILSPTTVCKELTLCSLDLPSLTH